MSIEREILMRHIVEDAVSEVNRRIWSRDLSAAESRLAAMQVIEMLVTSVTIDRQRDVIAEQINRDIGLPPLAIRDEGGTPR